MDGSNHNTEKVFIVIYVCTSIEIDIVLNSNNDKKLCLADKYEWSLKFCNSGSSTREIWEVSDVEPVCVVVIEMSSHNTCKMKVAVIQNKH